MTSKLAFSVPTPLHHRICNPTTHRSCSFSPSPSSVGRHVSSRRAILYMTSSNPRQFKYVVIGAGNAAGYVARAFVESGSLGPDELCLIGDESHLPYERPALSKAVLFNPSVRLPGFNTCVGSGGNRQTDDYYKDNGITTMLGSSVESFDAKSRTATLADGQSVIATEAAIIATGAVPIRLDALPGGGLRGIHYIRKYEEALALAEEMASEEHKKVVVLGGGYIGMEASAAANIVGCDVTVAFPETHLMSRLFTPDIAANYEAYYAEKGIKMCKGVLAKAFVGEDGGRVKGVEVEDVSSGEKQTIDADLVIVGVGARPESRLLEGQVLMDEQGGVSVNGRLCTAMEAVYAIGDVAVFRQQGGSLGRMEHVQNARKMAKHVVKSVLRQFTESYSYVPYFYSRVFDLSWQFFGDNRGECVVLRPWTVDAEGKKSMLAVWLGVYGELARINGVFMEGAGKEDSERMRVLATENPRLSVESVKSCQGSSVEECWALLVPGKAV